MNNCTALNGDQKRAPGGPGEPPRWPPASKEGIGTALGGSPVWFTIGRGAVEEVFYPSPDRPRIAGLALGIGDGSTFLADERTDAVHEVARLDEAIPLYSLVNKCTSGRYEIHKTIFTDPSHDVLIQEIAIRTGPDCRYNVYVHLEPRLSEEPGHDTAWLADFEGQPILLAKGSDVFMALASSAPWSATTVGFAGTSDGRVDLATNGRLTNCYSHAEDGTVSLTGAVDLDHSEGRFVLALGFGDSMDSAARRAIHGLSCDREAVREAYRKAWSDWLATLNDLTARGDTSRNFARVSAAVLRTHMAKKSPGAIVASLSTPWGDAQTSRSFLYHGGYHMVWPRDQVEAAGGLLSVGATAEAKLVLEDLRLGQSPDGHWPQNMWCDGTEHADGIQLCETALPILLADRLHRERSLTTDEARAIWPMIREAVSYIVSKGPSTQQDRWENQSGYTPFTIAVMISALLAAADAAESMGECEIASFLRETADAWNSSIEDWLYVEGTDLARRVGVEGYYLRIAPHGWAERAATGKGMLDPAAAPRAESGFPVTEVVSPDALAFVRFGLRRADDPRIVATVKVIDATLQIDTPRGPSWHRYTGDGYGEDDDGAPFTKRTKRTRGRAWPLLTGERAHYELAAGRPAEAARLLTAMERLASDSGMISEQVWDREDVPAKRLFLGRPTGSAMPLAWAHAEYLTLCRSIALGRIADCPPQTQDRFVTDGSPHSAFVIWRPDHRRHFIPMGKALRIELPEPGRVEWRIGNQSAPAQVADTRDSTLRIHFADIPIQNAPAGARVHFTIVRPNEVEPFEVHIAGV
jgi:glucoamylase